jgi:hypothetical protein
MTSFPFRNAVTPRRRAADPWLARFGVTRGLALALFLTLLAIALGFSALRGRIIHLRYQAAELLREEDALAEARRAAQVRLREMRDPRRLAALGSARGFARPERVLELDAGPAEPGP